MANPPLDPTTYLPAEDAYLISGRDMVILQRALEFAMKNQFLQDEIISLRQQLEKYQERFGEL